VGSTGPTSVACSQKGSVATEWRGIMLCTIRSLGWRRVSTQGLGYVLHTESKRL
jgi:hypothetical protein